MPDPNDRHVLAAAIHANADVIVTYNLKHFPKQTLASFGIEPQHPDEFVADLFDLHPGAVVGSVRTILKRLKNPPKTSAELMDIYARNQLVRTELALRDFFRK